MGSYYDPHAILADSQKLPTTFDLQVPQLAPLNNGTAIESGTKLELPLWLAEMLAVSRPSPSADNLASLDMPKALGQKVINALLADPTSVQVRDHATYFFGLGERMLELFEDEDLIITLLEVSVSPSLAIVSLLLIVVQSYKKRALQIADNGQNSRAQNKDSSFMTGLDDSERACMLYSAFARW